MVLQRRAPNTTLVLDRLYSSSNTEAFLGLSNFYGLLSFSAKTRPRHSEASQCNCITECIHSGSWHLRESLGPVLGGVTVSKHRNIYEEIELFFRQRSKKIR